MKTLETILVNLMLLNHAVKSVNYLKKVSKFERNFKKMLEKNNT